jgi:hypothetical protein
MADFSVQVAGAVLTDWEDPALPGAPSRLNARPGRAHKRWVVALGSLVSLRAVVGGVIAPLDSSLGGRLFVPFAVEVPPGATPFVGFSSPLGQSSHQTLTPTVAGHYALGLRRPNGGIEHVHLDVG